jgi:hypothetical protein
LFRSENFFRTTRELEYLFFLSRIARIFFQNSTLGYMTKTLNQIILFCLHQNQNIFFSNIGNQNIFLEKNHTQGRIQDLGLGGGREQERGLGTAEGPTAVP